eukprot:scaffold3911_cov60-Phaeocystis_antarctica.AAC.3
MERVLAGLHNVRTHRCVVSTYISMCTMSHWSVVVRRYIPGSDYARRARPSQSTSLSVRRCSSAGSGGAAARLTARYRAPQLHSISPPNPNSYSDRP